MNMRLIFAPVIWLVAMVCNAQETTATSEPLQRSASKGAPNVVLVLLDDVGFGAAATFGGPAATPTLDMLAHEGLRFNRFHTTAMCSPTRASLLTGRNAHVTGIASVLPDSRPGYNGFHAKDTATIAEILRQHGYSTAAFGKWHQTPDWELSQSGPFDRWPTGEGFEKFYGFQGGETNQFEPTLYDGTTPVMRRPGPGYHLTEDLADHAISWVQAQQSVTPDKPFFLYFAPGGIHAPIQVAEKWITPYHGKFDQGWDKLREEIFARQKKLGVIPANTKLTPRPESMHAWNSLTPDQKKIASRLMEAYAGFLEHTDVQIGRLVQTLKDAGQFDNTLFIYIVGDNGASAEGGLEGSLNYLAKMLGAQQPEEEMLARIDQIGGPEANAHINATWAWATDAPFQWTKTVASHLGGIRNPMVVTWPKRINDKGGLRNQFSHVNDIVPTILEAADIAVPGEVNGIQQKPMNGTSLIYTFDNAKATERHRTQYFELFGNRSIYHEGWMASAFHGRIPWKPAIQGNKSFDDDRWELYDLRSDFSQANDLAEKEPEKLNELKALFMQEAAANRVLPLAGQPLVKQGLPDLSANVKRATYHEGAVNVPESAIPKIHNRSWSVDAMIDADKGARGVIAALGGTVAGWSLYLDAQQRPVFMYRAFDLKTVELIAEPVSAGQVKLRVDFNHNKSGGEFVLSVNGVRVASDTVPPTPLGFVSIGEPFSVGIDTGSPAGRYPADAAPGYAIQQAKIDAVAIEAR